MNSDHAFLAPGHQVYIRMVIPATSLAHTYHSYSLYSFALLLPSRTQPIYQLFIPASSSYLTSASFLSWGMLMSSPPLVSAANPSISLKSCTFFSIFIRFLQTGSLLMIRSTLFFCAWARQFACPRIPKPVTSVHAFALYLVMSLAPTMLRVAICYSARQKASRSSLSVAQVKIFYLFYLLVLSHCIAFMANLDPKGFVRMRESPGQALLGITNSFSLTTAIAHPPIIGQGLYTVCPPPTWLPACCAASVKPWIISVVETSFSRSFMSVETPKIIKTSLMLEMPIAQRSETVLQKAMRPNMQGDSTSGQKKSTVDTRVQASTLMVETSGVSIPTGLGSLERQDSSLFCGTLHPHPFIFVKLVSTKSSPSPCSAGTNGFMGGGFPLLKLFPCEKWKAICLVLPFEQRPAVFELKRRIIIIIDQTYPVVE